MVVLRNVPAPFGEPIAKQPRSNFKPGTDPQAGMMTLAWINFFTAQNNQLDSITVTANAHSVTDQTGSVGATDITNGAIHGGQYRLSWWYGVTTPNGISSSLQVSFDYTYRGSVRTITGPTLVGNTTSEASDDVRFIPVDGNTPVRYTVTYASGAGAPMLYDLVIALEQVPL